MQEASRRKLKAISVLVIYSVPESLLWSPASRTVRLHPLRERSGEGLQRC